MRTNTVVETTRTYMITTMTKQSLRADPSAHRKRCSICNTPRDVLIRCQVDESGVWNFVCPGKCWQSVSGGVIDGDLEKGHEYYRYGGMWKNKHAGVSAKVPKRLKGKLGRKAAGEKKEDKGHESEGSDGSAGSDGSRGSLGSKGSRGHDEE